MAQTPITELDFFQIKNQLKAYLRGQARFQDYDFDGANLSVLLDILAYNTYQNNFYTNMAISEMFLDSAQLESSIMSHAKELNYLPTSASSSTAYLNLRITAPSVSSATITIPAGQKFYTSHNGSVYNFYTNQAFFATQVSGSPGVYQMLCMPVYEGEVITETAYLSSTSTFVEISNANVDISSVKVFLNNGSEEFLYRSSIFGVQPTDNVFYIEPTLTGNYCITFGKDTFGRQPTFNEDIRITYRVCSGDVPNGAYKFTTVFDYPTVVSTYSIASGGSNKESLEDTKYFAPKSIQTQERAVTANDYEILLRKEFGSSMIKSVSVYGGDELNPPRFGKVAISINPRSGTTISDSFKTSVISYLADKTPLPIQPIFVDPNFMYANMNLNVYYTKRQTSKSAIELETLVRQSILDYSDAYLDDFGSSLKISRLSNIIDNADIGIMSNTMSANPIIDYSPRVGLIYNPTFRFGSALSVPYEFDSSVNISNYIPAIKSSVYNFNNVEVYFQDDGLGNIMMLGNNKQFVQVLSSNIGTVDYNTGTLNLANFITSGYSGTAIKIYANTVDRNINSPKDSVLSIRSSDITINMIES